MIKLKHLLSLLSLVSCLLSAQEALVIDELGSPIKEVHLVNLLGDVHTFTDKNGLADLSIFDANETIIISHSGFLSLSLSKSIIASFDNQITLIFDSETIGEVILLTRIDDENLKTTADRRVILHSKEIERLNTQNTADLLEKRAGINVQKSQMGGGSPVIRGFEANRILLVVDGVRLNNAIYRGGHLQNIISIDNASLEQVDIIFGPSSSEYGSDALGGIIHLKTKRPKFSEKPKFLHSYSTRYATVNKGISKHYDMQYTGAAFALFSSFSHSDFDDLRMGSYRSHGYSDWGKVYHFIEDGVQQENTDPNIQRNTGYSQTDFMQKVILKIDPQWTLTGNFQYSNSSNIPRFDKLNDYKTVDYDSLNNQTIYNGLKYASWNYGPQKRYFSSIQLDHSVNNVLMDSAQLIFAYQDVYESRRVQKIGSEESINRYEEVDIYSFNANFRKNKLRYGLEYYSNSVYSKANLHSSQLISPYEQTRYPNGGSSMSSAAGYLTYSKSFGEQLKLHSGLRYTQNELKALFHNTRTWTLPYDSIGYKYKALTGNLSIAYHPNESWKIAAIASTGFHAPNIDDTGKLFIKSKILTIPNFNLAPEFAKTIELNITKNINNRILINANAYYTLIDDAIMRVDADTNDYNGFVIDPDEDFLYIKTNKNTGTAEIFGATASISMRIASKYTLESDYTYIKGRNIKNDLPFTHIPPSFGKTAFYADYDNWRASFFVLYNGRKAIEEYDIESGTDNEEESPIEWVLHEESNSMIIEYQGTPAWYTLNMSAMYRFSGSFTAQVALENILDSHYKTFASGLSAPGRNFILTLRAKF
jgi:hemoglobin/transferrin/lactoferrin receptor protein